MADSTTSSSSTQLLLLAAAGLLLPLALLSASPARVLRYLQRKRYQYEVTFSLYMMTPTEKFIFNSILFLFVAMVLIAAALYLPANVANVAGRAWYYLGGDDAGGASGMARAAAVEAGDTLSAGGKEVVVESARTAAAAAAAAV